MEANIDYLENNSKIKYIRPCIGESMPIIKKNTSTEIIFRG